ncbi:MULTISPECIES: helix-turn-helix domain-containing protein [Cupriavidus]
MRRFVYAEFDEFEASLYGVQGRYVLRSRPERDWRLRVVDLDGVALMCGREGAATVYSGIGMPGYFNLFVPLSGQDATVVDGHRFDGRTVAWMAPDRMFHIDASRPASWLTVAMSDACVRRWAGAHGDEFDPALFTRNLICTRRDALRPLLALVRRLFQVDSRAPECLRAAQAGEAARGELLALVFHAVLPPDEAAGRHRRLDARAVLQRAMALLKSMSDVPIHMGDLCAATGASERTLRNVFHQYLGMSPHRYLMLYRMHLIRKALIHAGPADTVTVICARYGVWDFGRFAMLYNRYFGELPSHTLRGRGTPLRLA